MAERFRFFDSIDGQDERYYTADEFAEYFRQFIRNGVFNGGTDLQVVCSGTDMNIMIQPGYAWLEGYLYKIDTGPLVLTLDAAGPNLDRIDRVVVRLDKRLENRYVKTLTLKGQPAEVAIAPELTRDENTYEIALAQVEILAGKSFVEQHQITDERLNNDVCGVVTHLFDQVNTAEIFNEWLNYLNYKKAQGDSNFLIWQEYLVEKENQVNKAVEDFIFFLQDAEGGDITQWLEDFKLLVQQEWRQWFNEQQTEGFMVSGESDRVVNIHRALNQRVDTRKEELIYDGEERLIKVLEKDGEYIVKDTELEYGSSDTLVKITETIPGSATDTVITQYLIYDLDGNLERVERSVG